MGESAAHPFFIIISFLFFRKIYSKFKVGFEIIIETIPAWILLIIKKVI